MLASLPLHGCLPKLQFSASSAVPFIIDQNRSSYVLNWSVRNACTFGSSRFQVLRFTTVTLMAQPSEIGIRYLVTSVQPAEFPTEVPVTAQSTTLFWSA